ncbi:Hpr(Ser) kinase/phosphatase [Paracoccus laeviglucosivorans]|uniref:Hpr(Ser) kinase/phosphatase n=2 Tax=Paracoccus laeviglucosivorans TaxID=1197861 RepID=A0A521CGR0_9RHOB|nr:Hpr(Ser) kinase/phosphatase [Paracoccus laeviglucosivorans]
MDDKAQIMLHGTCVAVQNRGLMILGASGAGKSTLALALMALGAALVADDRVIVTLRDGRLIAHCPDAILGRIEARGVGILHAAPAGPVELALVVDLDRSEPQRLPPHRKLDLLGRSLPLVWGRGRDHLAPVLLQYLIARRADPEET